MLTKNEIRTIKGLTDKKNRDQLGLFTAEGCKIINDYLQTPNMPPAHIYGVEECLENLLPLGQHRFTAVSARELASISTLKTPQQALAVLTKPAFQTPNTASSILILDGIQDPGNLGTLIRLADWFAINQIIASPHTADCYNPKVVQATMGSLFRVAVTYTHLDSFLNHYPHPTIGAVMHGSSLFGFQKPAGNFALVIGSEGRGIAEDLQALLQYQLTIPKYGNAESLNAAVAAGIFLAHFAAIEPQ